MDHIWPAGHNLPTLDLCKTYKNCIAKDQCVCALITVFNGLKLVLCNSFIVKTYPSIHIGRLSGKYIPMWLLFQSEGKHPLRNTKIQASGSRWQSRRVCTHLLQEPQNYNQLLNNHQQEDAGTTKNRYPTSKDKEEATAGDAAAKSLQLCLTLCDSRDGSPPGFAIPGILQARTLEWVAISFSNA